jgi:hypothetical protein
VPERLFICIVIVFAFLGIYPAVTLMLVWIVHPPWLMIIGIP